MTEGIVVALIASLGGLVGSVIGMISNKNMVEYKIDLLTKKVEEHNKLITRTYELEKITEIQEEKIKVANHRLDDLEQKVSA